MTRVANTKQDYSSITRWLTAHPTAKYTTKGGDRGTIIFIIDYVEES